MWEVFTCGKMPYGRLKNAEVVERVQRGIVLERPPRCPEKIYAVRPLNDSNNNINLRGRNLPLLCNQSNQFLEKISAVWNVHLETFLRVELISC